MEWVSQMYMLLHKTYLVKWSTNGGKGSKMSKKMSTWFMTQIIAFHDVTAKFYDMGLSLYFSECEILNGILSEINL